MEDAVRLMPKIDLHCHLDGSLTLESVRKITGRNVAPEELQADDRCRDLAEYLKKFELDLPVRFDIISVIGTCAPFEIKHIKDAFLPPIW